MSTFAISGRYCAAQPPADWREQLALMLGARPRRIGAWAELGLYGALRCMAETGEPALPQGALLLLGSRRGTLSATMQALEQMRTDLPMPLTFLQTQPSQLLALLAAQLHWRGHGVFLAGGSAQALLHLAAVQCGEQGALIGWVDEVEAGGSRWLCLRPCAEDEAAWREIAVEELFACSSSRVKISAAGLCAA